MQDIADPPTGQADGKLQKLFCDLIEANADTQSRQSVDEATVAEYTQTLEQNPDVDPFPPIDGFSDGAEYWIGDGWHRYLAYVRAGRTVIPATVRVGTLRDARLFAAAANKAHGLKRSNADKRRAVEIMLRDEEWCAWSDRRIAEHCGVSNQFVSNVRRQVSTVDTCDDHADQLEESSSCDEPDEQVCTVHTSRRTPAKRVGADGKAYPVKAKPAAAAKTGPNIAELEKPYKEMMQAISNVKRRVTALAETPEGTQLKPKLQRVRSELEVAYGTIRMATPAAVCEHCGGCGRKNAEICNACMGTGTWTLMVVQSRRK